MFYYFQDKHKLLDGKLEFKEQNYNFNSYEMELYSVVSKATPKKIVFCPKTKKIHCVAGCWDRTQNCLRLRHWKSDAITTLLYPIP